MRYAQKCVTFVTYSVRFTLLVQFVIFLFCLEYDLQVVNLTVKNTEENDHEQLDVKWDHNAELEQSNQMSFVNYQVAYSDFKKLFNQNNKTEILPGNQTSIRLTDLKVNTIYWVKIGILLNGTIFGQTNGSQMTKSK